MRLNGIKKSPAAPQFFAFRIMVMGGFYNRRTLRPKHPRLLLMEPELGLDHDRIVPPAKSFRKSIFDGWTCLAILVGGEVVIHDKKSLLEMFEMQIRMQHHYALGLFRGKLYRPAGMPLAPYPDRSDVDKRHLIPSVIPARKSGKKK